MLSGSRPSRITVSEVWKSTSSQAGDVREDHAAAGTEDEPVGA